MRKEGVRRADVARKFNLSSSRIDLIERRDAADRLMAERRSRLRGMLRTDDDMEKLVVVEDLVDAIGMTVVAKNRLMDNFVAVVKNEISLRELMDMCLDAPVEGLDFMMSPLVIMRGIGPKGFWSLAFL